MLKKGLSVKLFNSRSDCQDWISFHGTPHVREDMWQLKKVCSRDGQRQRGRK